LPSPINGLPKSPTSSRPIPFCLSVIWQTTKFTKRGRIILIFSGRSLFKRNKSLKRLRLWICW